MIEVNLLPGGAKRTARKARFSFKLPRFQAPTGLSVGMDRWAAAIAASWIVCPLLIGWLVMGTRDRKAELEAGIEQALQDSTRYAELIRTAEALKARRDSIAQKLQVIQEVDAIRYVWAHLMDEVSRALPEYTWLTELVETRQAARPAFQIKGRTGNTFALTQFMSRLEASPFIRGVRLASTQLAQSPGGVSRVYEFVLEAEYEDPPPDLIETVPLFQEDEVDGTATE